MSWNYRILKTQAEGDVAVWGVHEVYYDAAGVVERWSDTPVYPIGETWTELQKEMRAYARALTLRPIDVTSGTPVEDDD